MLLDLVMPVMDGFGVLSYMNERNWIEDIPVIMISGEDSVSYVRRAFDLGVADYIKKPFDAQIVYRQYIIPSHFTRNSEDFFFS